jgi:hypothetical protein
VRARSRRHDWDVPTAEILQAPPHGSLRSM